MRTALGVLFLAAGVLAQTPPGTPPTSAGADASLYCVTDLADLKLVEGTRPSISAETWWQANRPQPYAVLDGPGEAYVVAPQPAFNTLDPESGASASATRVALRIPARREVTGRVFVEGPELTLVALRFEVPADAFSPDQREAFALAARDHDQALLDAGLPGAAWWRHRARLWAERAGRPAPPDAAPRWPLPGRGAPSNMDDTFELFTGSRAIAENLQLERILPPSPKDPADLTRKVDEIQGITVTPYDWSQATAGPSPQLDPLAALIPADQHAVFFPSFQALIDTSDQADAQGTPVLQALSDPTGEAGAKDRYQRQLGLPMSDLARVLGPALIDSVALTGGDPYLATGSDVALVFQAKDVDVLQPVIAARVAAAAASVPGAAERTGEIEGVSYVARVSPDRAVSSYVCRLGGAVAVTNSEAQLRRLVAVSRHAAPALAAAPEYVFFRSRYPRGAANESALLVLSDATIRRWCGPRWRIGDSRRTRAAAALSELQARAIEAGLAGSDDAGVTSADAAVGLGELTLSRSEARSSIYGSLAFMTPIAELDLDRVSEDEAVLYGRWRDGYQQNWSARFDPIAVRLEVAAGLLAADVTVRPLIVGSDYKEFVDLSRGARIAPLACDPHDGALVHWAVAIDKHSPLIGEQSSMLSMMLPNVDVLGWLGQSVSIYLDDDPFWDELRAAEKAEDFLEHNWPRLPVALHAEVGNGLLLTAFLVGVRGMVEQSSPDMTVWENHTYHDEPFVSIRPSARAIEDTRNVSGDEDSGLDRAALYYAASGDGLVVSLNQALIERAIDRRLQRKAQRAAETAAAGSPAPASAPSPAPAPAPVATGFAESQAPWLGEQLALRVKGETLGVVERLWTSGGIDQLRAASFANLPILNEWHRLVPGEDPVAVHERLWHRRLLCPGGGTYRWNEEWQTMESSVYGHPGDRRDGPSLPPALARILGAAAGLTFEADGLRARFELQQGL